jgi:molybdate transport system substrate-binding protein
VFPQLGIADRLSSKTSLEGVAAVVRGDADFMLQPVSELLHASGVDFVGTIPKEIQFVSVFSDAIVSGAKEPELAKRLLAFLASPSADAAIKNQGMERVLKCPR